MAGCFLANNQKTFHNSCFGVCEDCYVFQVNFTIKNNLKSKMMMVTFLQEVRIHSKKNVFDYLTEQYNNAIDNMYRYVCLFSIAFVTMKRENATFLRNKKLYVNEVGKLFSQPTQE